MLNKRYFQGKKKTVKSHYVWNILWSYSLVGLFKSRLLKGSLFKGNVPPPSKKMWFIISFFPLSIRWASINLEFSPNTGGNMAECSSACCCPKPQVLLSRILNLLRKPMEAYSSPNHQRPVAQELNSVWTGSSQQVYGNPRTSAQKAIRNLSFPTSILLGPSRYPCSHCK